MTINFTASEEYDSEVFPREVEVFQNGCGHGPPHEPYRVWVARKYWSGDQWRYISVDDWHDLPECIFREIPS